MLTLSYQERRGKIGRQTAEQRIQRRRPAGARRHRNHSGPAPPRGLLRRRWAWGSPVPHDLDLCHRLDIGDELLGGVIKSRRGRPARFFHDRQRPSTQRVH